ncbi:hypothetical protein DD594_26185, partial [Enterobacter cloacae complex sp. 4DZ1-17B1]
EVEPFVIPEGTLKPASTWIQEDLLESNDLKIYQGVFKDTEGNVIELPMLRGNSMSSSEARCKSI